jgi:hypothetical protein
MGHRNTAAAIPETSFTFAHSKGADRRSLPRPDATMAGMTTAKPPRSFQELHNRAMENALNALLQLLHEKNLITLPEYIARIEHNAAFAQGAFGRERNPILDLMTQGFRGQAAAYEAAKKPADEGLDQEY